MPRVTTAFAAAVALFLPIGRPLLVGLSPAAGIGAGLLSTQTAYAQNATDLLNSGLDKAKSDVDTKVQLFSKQLEIAKTDIIERLENGEKRSEIVASYRAQFAPSNMKILHVHCENNTWFLSIKDQIELTSPGMKNYILELMQTSPEKLQIKFKV